MRELPGTPSQATAPNAADGILPAQDLLAQIGHAILVSEPLRDDQVQPASLDLRLGPKAYRVRASFLPGASATVADRLAHFAMHEMDIASGGVLEKGCVYIVPLMESLRLPPGLSAIGNPKSSTGRIDVFTRLITDHGVEFDRVRDGYRGPLYAEISPRTFSVLVRKGTRLSQLRVRRGASTASDLELRRLQDEHRLVDRDLTDEEIRNGVPITVDLGRELADGVIGYRAKSHAGLIDLDRVGHYDWRDFWDPVSAPRTHGLILDPSEFYILASKEAVRVPPGHAAEMIAFDTLVGEFRVHYAGFFDPGFGHPSAGGEGSRAVLEVRSYEVPFVIQDGQVVGRLVYERLTSPPERLYGVGLKSNYQQQGLRLSKHFR
ncbi:MAG TPA: 2'-deoxycytidine 5'-triphosphate deaminase [Nevskiaceae bacterium]|nr:2'-deoxycytidine 5'-triphosphate deaminase [Nevskiaceae bacterium]